MITIKVEEEERWWLWKPPEDAKYIGKREGSARGPDKVLRALDKTWVRNNEDVKKI